jgi:uncharacterized protein
LKDTKNIEIQVQKGIDAYSNDFFDEAFSIFMPLAKIGDAGAQYFIGNFYDNGLVVAEDSAHAIYWYDKSYKQGNTYAQAALAHIYSGQYDVTIDVELSDKYAQEVIKIFSTTEYETDSEAIGWLGYLSFSGIGCSKDLALAEDHFKKCIQYGDATGWLGLSGIRMAQISEENVDKVISEPQLTSECIEFLEKGTKANNYMAWSLMGNFFDNGVFEAPSRVRSLNYYLNAAKLGHVESMIKVAEKYEKGIGASKNHQQTLRWLLEAEERGSTQAQYALGTIRSRVPDINISDDKLLNRIVSAAEKKYPPAMYVLCNIIKSNPDLGSNDELILLREAAELGEPRAKKTFGLKLCFGDQKIRDPEKGFEFIRSSVDTGHIPAYFAIALCYLNGSGIEQDFNRAVEHFEVALSEGYYLAALALGEIYTDPDYEGFDNKVALAYLQLAQNRLTESHYIEKANQLVGSLAQELSIFDCEKSNEWAAEHTRFHCQ